MEPLDRSSSPKILPLGKKSRKKLETAYMAYPPKRLMMHLIRTRSGRDVKCKDRREISLPEMVNTSQFRAEEEDSEQYWLPFLVSHIGMTTRRGHSIAYHSGRSKKNG
jgi:hypothetical protein